MTSLVNAFRVVTFELFGANFALVAEIRIMRALMHLLVPSNSKGLFTKAALVRPAASVCPLVGGP